MKNAYILLLAFFLHIQVDLISAEDTSLFNFPPEANPQLVGKLVSENLLSRDYMMYADDSGIHYAEIITADAAITFATQTRDTSLFLQLEERYTCFLKEEQCNLVATGSHNKFMAALVVLDMYNWGKQENYLNSVYSLVQDKWDKWADPDPITGILKSARFWADDMYFTPTLESRIFKINDDPSTIDRVTKWLTAYVDSLQLPNGLIKHTTQVPFVWGRGSGWAAVGLTNALQDMPLDHPKRAHLMDSYLKLMAGLKPYQSPNGLWRQLIDYPEAWEETSGSAMFTYSMITGIRMGWLEPEIYGPIVEKAWLALVNKLIENGELADVCVGTNEKTTAQEYLDRPRRTGDMHGQAPVLWTANALLLLGSNATSIDNEKLNWYTDDLMIYPNPAKDQVFIRMPNINDREISLNLYSVTGSLIISKQLSLPFANDEISIHVSILDDGLYIYQMKNTDVTFTGKLYINK
ncbi:glycoside hydrolase family 88 protein [Bacteroidota bacterium]